MVRVHYIIIVFLFFSVGLSAQWECPSQLGGALKPFGNSNLMWGTELTAGGGYLTNNSIFNAMGLVALDYSWAGSTFYFEGGYKYWYRYDYDQAFSAHNQHPGLREFYYQNRSKLGKVTLGLQSMLSDDGYLVNERVLGAYYSKDFTATKLKMFGGTVTKDFSRNGTFCDMEYLYDILPRDNRPLTGNTPGQTNMAGFTLSYSPSSSGESEFSGDGLSEASDMQGIDEGQEGSSGSGSFARLESVGTIFYSEFGSWVSPVHFYYGIYSTIELGKGLSLTPEVLYQSVPDANALIFNLHMERDYIMSNGHKLAMGMSLHALHAIDKGATAVNMFSNIFAGNVLRLDSPDIPFGQVGARYTIPSVKTHLKLQYTRQFVSSPMSEFDSEIGARFFGKMMVNFVYGRINAPQLQVSPDLFRVEMRIDL